MRRQSLLVTTLAIAVVLLALGTGRLPQPSLPQFGAPDMTSPGLTRGEAVQRGLQLAHQYGLQGEPWGLSAQRMTLREAMALNEAQVSDEGGQFGRDPQKAVWLIVLRGVVNLTGLPGLAGQTQFDNMILIIDAMTGELIAGPGALNPGVQLPLPVSVTPGSPTEVPIVITPRPVPLTPRRVTPARPLPPGVTPPVTPRLLPTPTPVAVPSLPPTRLPPYPLPTVDPRVTPSGVLR